MNDQNHAPSQAYHCLSQREIDVQNLDAVGILSPEGDKCRKAIRESPAQDIKRAPTKSLSIGVRPSCVRKVFSFTYSSVAVPSFQVPESVLLRAPAGVFSRCAAPLGRLFILYTSFLGTPRILIVPWWSSISATEVDLINLHWTPQPLTPHDTYMYHY